MTAATPVVPPAGAGWIRISSWLTPIRLAVLIAGGWTLLMIVLRWQAIMLNAVQDPDDLLRLVQIRDLVDGQAWWDVTQYRMNPAGGGGQMHWSRIVDAPIAVLIAILTPLVDRDTAEIAATAIWPGCLLACALAAMATILDRLGGRRFVLAGLMLLVVSPAVMFQFMPQRIDHHGWQIMLAACLLVVALGRPGWWRGALGGLFSAMLLAISIEGLPITAMFIGLCALRWATVRGDDNRAMLSAYAVSFGGLTVALQYLTRGPLGLADYGCDAVSVPYMAMLGTMALAIPLVAIVSDRQALSLWWRLALLAAAGAGCIAVVAVMAPSCLRGPFSALDPIVYQHWYVLIEEGMMLWNTSWIMICFMGAPIAVGMVGSLFATLHAPTAELRRDWLVITAALAGATAVGLMVARAGATAQLFALPGVTWLVVAVWRRAQALRTSTGRIAGSLAAFALIPPAIGTITLLMVFGVAGLVDPGSEEAVLSESASVSTTCRSSADIRAMAMLPHGLIMTPMDYAAAVLRYSDHKVVTTGHHRNTAMMAREIRAFLAPSAIAEQQVRAMGVSVVLTCPGPPELRYYARVAPEGLAAQLVAGRPPAWLEPIRLPAETDLQAWRVLPRPAKSPAPR